MNNTPAKELTKILLPAYGPCPEFESSCKGIARWDPEKGHVPRGFVGATSLKEVEVVILFARRPVWQRSFLAYPQLTPSLEPGKPYTFEHHRDGTDLFHRNLRLLLDLIFPRLRGKLEEQLKKAWITETYLCSAPREGGNVPASAEHGCADRYLAKQLALFEGLPVIALGGKAEACKAIRAESTRSLLYSASRM